MVQADLPSVGEIPPFDAVPAFLQLELIALDLGVNICGEEREGLLHLDARSGRSLHERHAVVLRQQPGLILADLSGLGVSRGQVQLAPDEYEPGRMGLDVSLGLREPRGDVRERVSVANVVQQEHADRVPVVGLGDGPEPLLAGRVPQLQLDVDAVRQPDQLGEEVDPDGRVADLGPGEGAVGEVPEEGALADGAVANEDDPELVIEYRVDRHHHPVGPRVRRSRRNRP